MKAHIRKAASHLEVIHSLCWDAVLPPEALEFVRSQCKPGTNMDQFAPKDKDGNLVITLLMESSAQRLVDGWNNRN